VLERAWAAAGGAATGKNAQCLLPGLGSHFLLGGLLLDGPCPAPPSAPAPDPCGPCDACLRACPGGALVAPGRLDARLCLSYWTLEHPGVIPPGPASRMGRWIAGCDACQEICPHVRNRIPTCRAPFLRFEPERDAPRLDDVLSMTAEGFRARYAGTPLERVGLSRFRRNAVVALAGVGGPGAARALECAARDADPLVAEQARQARSGAGS
jgi:epoxyqueuosine reductase QueG